MDPISLLLSLGGLGLGVYALLTAKSAKQAATTAVRRKDDQEDRDHLAALIVALVKAKDAAKRRQSGAPEIQGAGRTVEYDIYILTDAHDALCTALPLSFGDELKVAVDAASDEIQLALGAIHDPTTSNRDGWKDSLAALQTLIPRLRQEEREMKNQEVLAD